MLRDCPKVGWEGAEIPLLALHPGHFQEALGIFVEHFQNHNSR